MQKRASFAPGSGANAERELAAVTGPGPLKSEARPARARPVGFPQHFRRLLRQLGLEIPKVFQPAANAPVVLCGPHRTPDSN